MVDENAFGLLMSFFDIEDEEYASDDTQQFVSRFQAFERMALELAGQSKLPEERLCVCLGHAVYVEFPDPEQDCGLFSTVRRLSGHFEDSGFSTVIALSYGGRWIDDEGQRAPPRSSGDATIVRLGGPSEPLRRALCADTGARGDDSLEGWGAGVYVDTEALEALQLTPKNSPTVLRAGGSTFLRVPPLPAQREAG